MWWCADLRRRAYVEADGANRTRVLLREMNTPFKHYFPSPSDSQIRARLIQQTDL